MLQHGMTTRVALCTTLLLTACSGDDASTPQARDGATLGAVVAVLAITMALFYARTLAAVVSAPLALILAGPPEGRGTVVKILAMWVVALTLALPFASVVTWMLD